MSSKPRSREARQRNNALPLAGSTHADVEAPASPSSSIPKSIPKLVLTPQEAAGALSIDRSTLYQLLMCGEIRSFKIGRCRRIPLDALKEWVVRQSQIDHVELPWLDHQSNLRLE
jgi:excisionase family DNA binding protein